MQRTIVVDGGNPIDTAVRSEEEAEDKIEIAENADAYEEVIRRQDNIDQLTADYLRALIGIDDGTIDLDDIGIDTESLYAIEDAIEEILNDFGINIYRPTIIEDENGNEIIISNMFDINQ